jgi:gamma-butyrobetaine dioxygenase
MRIEPTHARPGLQLRRIDGSVTPIHPRWLRERLDGPEYVDQSLGQRFYDPSDLAEDVAVTEVTEQAPGVWAVRFSDGAAGSFGAARLIAEAELGPANTGLPPRVSWTGSLSPMPIVPWQPNPSDAALLRMTETFLRYGFVILRGVPTAHATVMDVADAFGFARDTNFGKLFDVRSIPNPDDLANTGIFLDPHTDNPYRDPIPGVQLLHCIANRTSGGYSTLVDGVTVVEALRQRDPAAFEILSKTPIRFIYSFGRTELVDYGPIIEHDALGQIRGMRVSPKLEFVPLLAEAELDAFYKARRLLDRMLRDTEFAIKFLLGDGDLMMFDNRRLLHGRTGYDPQEGLRHLQGCYIDIDSIRSLYRVLSRSVAADERVAAE